MLDYIRNNSGSWVVKIIFGLIIFVFVFWGVGNIGHNNENVVATMDGYQIMIQELQILEQKQVMAIRAKNPEVTEADLIKQGLRAKLFQNLVVQKLLENEAKKLGIAVTPDELVAIISKNGAFLDEKGNFNPEIYRRVLQANYLTPATYESDMSKDILIQKLQQYVSSTVKVDPMIVRREFEIQSEKRSMRYLLFPASDYVSEVKISDQEIQSYYDNNKANFLVPVKKMVEYISLDPKSLGGSIAVSDDELLEYYNANKDSKYLVPEAFKARHIMITFPKTATKEEEKVANDKIEMILAELKKGKSFEALAKEFSQDGSAAQGGELGWVAKGETVEPFEAVLFTLKKGEISQPVRTDFGMHLIKAEDYRAASTQEFAKVKDEIKQTLIAAKADKFALDTKLKAIGLLESNLTFKQITEELQLPVLKTELLSSEELATTLRLTKEGSTLLDELSVDNPLSLQPLRTQDGVIIVNVLDNKPEYISSLDEVKDKIKDILVNEKAIQLAFDAAKKARTEFTDNKVPTNLEKKVLETTSVNRSSGTFPEFGESNKLVTKIFDLTEPNQWVEEPIKVQKGAVLASLGKIQSADDAEWEKNAETVILLLEAQRKQEEFQVYLSELLRLHPVEILNSAYLEGKK